MRCLYLVIRSPTRGVAAILRSVGNDVAVFVRRAKLVLHLLPPSTRFGTCDALCFTIVLQKLDRLNLRRTITAKGEPGSRVSSTEFLQLLAWKLSFARLASFSWFRAISYLTEIKNFAIVKEQTSIRLGQAAQYFKALTSHHLDIIKPLFSLSEYGRSMSFPHPKLQAR